jgi:hypothetical protein
MDSTIDIAPATPADPAAFERAHVRTYARFTHLIRWFVFHAMVDMIGIAGFVTGHPAFGVTFLVIGTALLIWGILTTRVAARRATGEAVNSTREVAQELAFLAGRDNHRLAA